MATKDILSETLDDFGLEMSDLMLERCKKCRDGCMRAML